MVCDLVEMLAQCASTQKFLIKSECDLRKKIAKGTWLGTFFIKYILNPATEIIFIIAKMILTIS